MVEEIALDGPGLHERNFDTCGDYTAHVVHGDGSLSQACEFAVCDLDLRLPESVSTASEWKMDFAADNMEVVAVQLWSMDDGYDRFPILLTEAQRRSGSLSIPAGLLKKSGTLQVWLVGEHKLGRLKLRKDIPLTE